MKNIKKYFLIIALLILFPFANNFAQENQYDDYSDKEGVIVPKDIDWTERYILNEIKSLRAEIERLRRFTIVEVNDREIETIDKALSYSANTVNYFFIIFTITIAIFGIFGWRSLLEIKNSLKRAFEKQLENILVNFQERLARIEETQVEKNNAITKKQKEFQKQQEISVIWSSYNREEDYRNKLEYLEKLEKMGERKNAIMLEKTNVYLFLGFYDKTLELCETLMKQDPDNTTLLYNRAAAYSALDKEEEATQDINQLISLSPHFIEAILEDKLFEGLPICEKLSEKL